MIGTRPDLQDRGVPMRALLGVLRGSLRGHRRDLMGLAAWAAIEAVPAFASGRLVALATDRGFLAHRPVTGLGWLALLAVAIAAGAWANRQMFRRLGALVEPFRDDLAGLAVSSALRASLRTGATGDTAGVARLTLQVEIAREAYASVLTVLQGFVVTTAGAVLGLVTLVPAVIPLVVVPLLAGLALFFGALRRLMRAQRASILAEERIAEEAADLSNGLRDTVASGGEGLVAARVEAAIDAQARATQALARLTAVRTLAVATGGWLPVVLILAAGPALVRRGVTTGMILGALTYLFEGLQPALQTLVRELGGNGLWLFVALGRLLDGAPAADVSTAPSTTSPQGTDLVLRNVGFRYGSRAEPVVVGLDLDVGAGDHLAIVGPSGVGKSTLAGLIAGMLEPQVGAVTMGGVDLAGLDAAALAQRRVLIPQEAYVFEGTLEENLAYLAPGASVTRIDEAVDRLGMRSLVDRLAGYGAALDGSSLSAGERQLITLARAYLSPAEVVILDEATCHLDPGAEARVEDVFARRPGTLIVIAHRISSALRARRILVMDGTRVTAGTHEELMATSALYRDLVGYWLA